MAYLECANWVFRGLGSEVHVQSTNRGSGALRPSEPETFLLMNAQILMFWKKKISKTSKNTIIEN